LQAVDKTASEVVGLLGDLAGIGSGGAQASESANWKAASKGLAGASGYLAIASIAVRIFP
jgi:hypothetical protein